MELSIIIVNWNAKEYLAKCLQSIINTTRSLSYEIIVVDNHSSDGSVRLIAERFPQVKVIESSENVGFSRANNIGIKESRGRYIYCVNSDIEVLSDSIGTLHHFMEQHPETGMLGPRVLNADRTIQLSCRRIPTLWNLLCVAVYFNAVFPDSFVFPDLYMQRWHYNALSDVSVLSGCFMVMRRKAIDEVGAFDERFFFYGEDVDICTRFARSPWHVKFLPDAEVVHYGGASSAAAPVRYFIEMQRADLMYWSKHHSRFSTGVYRVVMWVHHVVRVSIYSVRMSLARAVPANTRYRFRRHLCSLLWMMGDPGYSRYEKVVASTEL